MAEVIAEVMTWVEAELGKNPSAASGELFERARSRFPSIAPLSVRQFHARYPLQVKRRASAGGGRRKKRSTPRAATRKKAAARPARSRAKGRGKSADQESREAVRGVLMRFATELASAEAKADVVKVLAGADRYVDEVLAAAGS
ncbi:MAG: hypothetical protein KJO11_05845 [Gemmatimonadetes bacterium]|nr:hypothetical protein [Gemmatimonadota bacterium]MBT8405808.1 hypothetical protein [Gemmatimonadota bacterium]NNK62659.1 hypothetical protein [Gemmatimonadota bacterium]